MLKMTFKTLLFFSLFLLLFFSSLPFHSHFVLKASAQDIEEVLYKGKSSHFNSEKARSDIFKQAIKNTSFKYIQNFIGEKKMLENQALIQKKIIKNSKKYILFMKETHRKREATGIELSVLLKISPHNLKTLLLNEGLFYKSEDPLTLLPLISFLDKSQLRKFSWWQANLKTSKSSFLIRESQVFHTILKKVLRKNGFFSFSPVDKQLQNLIPLSFYYLDQDPRSLSISTGKYFESSLVLLGEVEYVKESSKQKFFKKLSLHIEAIQPKNDQVIARIQREKHIEIHPFENQLDKIKKIYEKSIEELSNQILTVWKRGRFETILLQLAFKGKMDHSKWTQLKNILSKNIPEIKGVRERLHSSRKVLFEVDSALDSQGLAQIFKSQKKVFSEFALQVQHISENKIDLRVKTN